MIEKSDDLIFPHGFSTRLGGVSTGIFSSMNLGLNRGDDPDKVAKNWKIFMSEAGIGGDSFVCGRQVHKNRVLIVGSTDKRSPGEQTESPEADGFVTNERNVPLVVFTADCIPLLMGDSINNVAAAVHCGWRSTVSDIEGEAVKKMTELGAEKEHIHAALGPAIDRCCFEVGEEVIDAANALLDGMSDDLYDKKDNGKYMLDLRGVLKKRLIQIGLRENNIGSVGGCTMCHHDRYWSHRYTGGQRGSMACIIEIPGNNRW